MTKEQIQLRERLKEILPKESNHYYVDKILQLFAEEVKEIIGIEEELKEGQIMATPFNAIILGKNELRRTQRRRLQELLGETK